MSRKDRNNQKLIALIIATVAAGIPLATSPGAQITFTDTNFLLIWVMPGIFGSFVTFLYFSIKMREIIGSFMLGYVLAVIIRFVGDILISNVAHGDLSLSLFVALGVGGFSGWFGSAMWALIRRQGRNQTSKS